MSIEEEEVTELPKFVVYDCASAVRDQHNDAVCSLVLPSRYEVDYVGLYQVMEANGAWGMISLIRYLNKRAKASPKNTIHVYFPITEWMLWGDKVKTVNLHRMKAELSSIQAVEEMSNEFFDALQVVSGLDVPVGESLIKFMRYKRLNSSDVEAEIGLPAGRNLEDLINGKASPLETLLLRQMMKRFPVDYKEFDEFRNLRWNGLVKSQ